MSAIICFDDPSRAPIFDNPRAERLVKGNPRRSTWEFHESADGLVSAGTWACEPGAWRIVFPATREEFFHVIEGRIRITNQRGEAKEFGPGDACVIPAGFEGIFEVIEPVRKRYVFIDRAAMRDNGPQST
ncbi:cupin domain-containing protein [Niveibacterium sp. SC-1]|uniref:cupin domain-containing protein n=1 Tax=Niveibacterium sp. SC-1 TaxID=3135646 RepID=UPI00311E845E